MLSPRTKGKGFGVYSHYMELDQGSKIQAEYIWIGGKGGIRSKTRTLPKRVLNVKEIPEWNFDGSSTGQAEGHYSEIWLKPVKLCPDPFRKGDNILVLCECLDAKTMEPLDCNTRANARKVFDKKTVIDQETWFGIEQEYTMFEEDGVTPLGWPKGGYPEPQGPYYCGVGCRVAYGRQIVEAHYRACLYANINISGINAEVMPGQWEYQIGPCIGIDSGDQIWLSRYLLLRVAEDFNVCVSFDPKPIKGDWNGAGSHTNYSTKAMREEGGYTVILKAMKYLEAKHDEHMKLYGKDNQSRLTGKHETAHFGTFKFGVADRGASIRIPRMAEIEGKGYFEDRRPAANCDPYLSTAKLVETTLLH